MKNKIALLFVVFSLALVLLSGFKEPITDWANSDDKDIPIDVHSIYNIWKA